MRDPKFMLRDIEESLVAAQRMLANLKGDKSLDHQSVRNMATQLRQATMYADQLTGIAEAILYPKIGS